MTDDDIKALRERLPALPMVDLSRDALYGYTPDQMRAYARAAVAAERERCATLCDEVAADAASPKRMRFMTDAGKQLYEGMRGGAINCAAAIRSST